MNVISLSAVFLATLFLGPATTQATEPTRVPVLEKVAHPHSYYWREMYMPQLTSGPSAATFGPDSNTVIYSMQGSLWQQDVASDTAYQLTQGPGYDYQPDWSPDGMFVVFARQHQNALNLVLYDVSTKTETMLTTGSDVYLEPRFSPDGKKLTFTSTRKGGYLGVYVADIAATGLTNIRAIVAGNVSKTYRYYYSAEDHAINPAWSADGKRLLLVTNPEDAWGTGGIWSVSVDNPADRKLLLDEETTWAARPQPDHGGKRILYSSYHGRQTHQLWIIAADGKYPLPLTFGDYDVWQPRWSHDDKYLLYTTNETGDLTLYRHTFAGGKREMINPAKRVYLTPHESLTITLKNENGKRLSGRVSVLASDGRHYGPVNARMHGDDYVDTALADHENHYFHCVGSCSLMVPHGPVIVSASHGFSHTLAEGKTTIKAGQTSFDFILQKNELPAKFGTFTSADMHVHMNYGGKYMQNVQTMAADAKAEDLDIIYNLIVNKEERIPDIAAFKPGVEMVGDTAVYQGQEYHSSYWGHMGFLHLDDHIITPDFTSYWHTGLASAYPTNAAMRDLANAQGAVTGYVHPFAPEPDPFNDKKLTHSLPVDVALGKTDYLEIVAFADHESTAAVWYRFLNLGMKLSAGAGTDAMTNYASLRGPLGLNRVFLEGAERDQPETLKKAIREGRGFVSNGPLTGLLVNGQKPGNTVELGKEGGNLKVEIALRSPAPVERLELVMNGTVVHTFPTTAGALQADDSLNLPVQVSGWVLLRAVAKKSHPFVQDIYTYATTNPVWISVAGKPQTAPEDARYFMKWLDRMAEDASARTDYNHDYEREEILAEIEAAKQVYAAKIK